jgi:hypothetical protein
MSSILAFLIIPVFRNTVNSTDNIQDSFFVLLVYVISFWETYIPYLFLIGLFMFVFTLFYDKLVQHRYNIQSFILLANIIWVIAASFGAIPFFNHFVSNIITDLPIGIISYIIVFAVIVINIISLITPNYVVWKRLKAENNTNSLSGSSY